MLLALLLALSTLAGAGESGPQGGAWTQAPPNDRPTVEAPLGGWTTQSGLYANVHGEAHDAAIVNRLANHAARSVPALVERLGVVPGGTIDVYLVGDEARFASLQPGQTPDWADGTAWPQWALVFLKSPSIRPGTAQALEVVLDHEVVHVLLGQAFGPRPVPRWLQEGMAQFYAGESAERAMAMAQGAYGGRVLPLLQFTGGFPLDPLAAQLAYAESADFIAWIAGRNGEAGLRELVRTMAQGASADEGIRAATGLSLAEADAQWRAPYESTDWARWLVHPAPWGALGGLGLGIAAWRRHRKGQAKLRRWEEEERRRAEALLGHPLEN